MKFSDIWSPALAAGLLIPSAMAQQAPQNVQPGFMSTNCPATSPCFIPGGVTQLNGFGFLSLTGTASTAISTLTAGPNSGPFPSGNTAFVSTVRIANQGSGTLYFCPFGGTCSASVGGFAIASGTTQMFTGVLTAATIAASAAGTTASISW